MSRSNAPLSLSVVKVTVPGSVQRTAEKILEFDGLNIGFNHDQTWRSMPLALRGRLLPDAVAASLSNKHPRIVKCVKSLCSLGILHPRETRAFADYPDAGIRPLTEIQWGPDVVVRARASCWYINEKQQPVIPILQPRKERLTAEQLAVYLRFAKQAFCKDEWVDALVEIIDLSGEDAADVTAVVVKEQDLPDASADLIAEYVKTYMAAVEFAQQHKKKRPPYKRDSGMDDIFDPTPP